MSNMPSLQWLHSFEENTKKQFHKNTADLDVAFIS